MACQFDNKGYVEMSALLVLSAKTVICWTLQGSSYIMGGVQQQGMWHSLPYGAAAGGGMDRFWTVGPEGLVLWIAILAALVAIAYYVIEKIRPKTVQKEPKASQWLSKFGELHSQGGLSDEEFRTIKTTLAAQLQNELKDNDDES